MKNVMNTMKLMFVMFLISAMIVGCGKSEGEKDKSETSGKENNPSSTTKKQSIDFFEEKEVFKLEKKMPVLSPGETIKKFYSAVSNRNYSEAKNYLSPELIVLLKSHPITVAQGLEKTLDTIAASGNLKEIKIKNEAEVPERYWKRMFESEVQIDPGTKLYSVEYTLDFKPPLDEFVIGWRERERCDYVIEKNGSCRILGVKIRTDERYEGIPVILAERLDTRLCEYNILKVSQSPAYREGWTTYAFTVGIRNTSSELVPIRLADIYAIAGGHKFTTTGWAFHPKSREPGKAISSGDVPEGYLLPGYSIVYCKEIILPTLASQIDFYLVTLDLRCLSLSTEEPFSPVPIFPPKNKNELTFGETFIIKDYLEVALLGLDLTKRYSTSEKPEKLRLWVRIKNLTLGDLPLSYETLYFQLLDDEGYTEKISYFLEETTVPPLFEKIRPFDSRTDIERGKNYALLIGIFGPNRKKEEPEQLLAYKIYRFEAQPTVSESEIKIKDIKAIWTNVYATITSPGGGRGFERIIINLKNRGNLPVYIDEIKLECKGFKSKTEVEKWIEPNSDATFEAIAGSIGANQTVSIEILSLNGRVITSYSGQILE